MGLVVAATLAQVVVFPYVAVAGVVPNLLLVVVVVAAFARGPEFAAGLGFCSGLLLDLAPPADHVAGRWALALVVVGYLAGRVRRDARSSTLTAVLVVGACSFVGTSLYALSGLVLQDAAPDAGSMIQVIAVSVLWDLLLAPLLVPALLRVLDAARPHRIEPRTGH
jgi:rod shape-determining protein MreD